MSKHPDDAAFVALKFAAAVLVCGDCEERSSGPKTLRAKEVRKELKRNLGDARFKLRVVQSSCLGLCPKRAMALVAIGTQASALGAEVRSEAEVARFAAHLTASCR